MSKPKWLTHFKLTVPPFSKEIDDVDLWLPSSKADIVDVLREATHEHASVLLVGDPGVGKTCLLRALRHRLPEAGFRLTYCHNATLGRRDFYRQICFALDLPVKASAAGVFWSLSTHVRDLARDRVHPVFLLDESHLMRDEVLQHLHILSNYSWDQKPLLSIVLVGLPDLWRRLSLGIHRSLWSRIQCRLALDQASPDDTIEYVNYRLERAGGKSTIFVSSALALLHEASAGQLRDIDRLATASLRSASRRKLKHVDTDLLQDVIDADSNLD